MTEKNPQEDGSGGLVVRNVASVFVKGLYYDVKYPAPAIERNPILMNRVSFLLYLAQEFGTMETWCTKTS